MRFRAIYPIVVGLLLGTLQTGLYFQLTFTLSSGFGTYLMVTLCWLLGSMIGVLWLARQRISTLAVLLLAACAYVFCSLLLLFMPFNTTLVPLYAGLMKTPEGQKRARAIYAKARARYHPIAQTAIDKIVK